MKERLSRRAAFGLLPALGPAAITTTPATAAALMAAPCPAEAIGRELAALAIAADAADRAWLDALPEGKEVAHRRFSELEDRLLERTEALANARASSLGGALAQAMLAASDALEFIGGAEAKRINRCMVSALSAIEAHGGVRREDVAGDFLLSRSRDATRAQDAGAGQPGAFLGLVRDDTRGSARIRGDEA